MAGVSGTSGTAGAVGDQSRSSAYIGCALFVDCSYRVNLSQW